LKLATALNDARKKVTRIETRGEGGYIVIPGGSAPYVHEDGPAVADGTPVSPDELDYLLDLARSFDEVPSEVPDPSPAGKGRSGNRPGDRFNRECAEALDYFKALLEEAGWSFVRVCPGGGEYWRRPGKTDGVSATLAKCKCQDGTPGLYV